MKENGFTLVEMLVVLAIGALLLTGIASVLGGFGDTLRRTQMADRAIVQMSGTDEIRELLEGALYVDESGALYPQSNARLEFRTPAPQALDVGGLRHVALLSRDDGKSYSLVLDDLEQDLAVPDATLLSDADAIRFESRTQAMGKQQKPRISQVKVNLRLPGNTEATIVAHPKLNTQGPCVFDPISQECRP
jgi:prepilin-type N-terminal cleavage/methylation domain-containing protein